MRSEAAVVDISVPGERWSVKIPGRGPIEVERFVSNGEIFDETALANVFAGSMHLVENKVALSRLATFLETLRDAAICFRVLTVRSEAVMVDVSVPGERWEVEFLDDGSIEIERFVSHGAIQDENALAELFVRFSEPTEPGGISGCSG